MHLLASLWLPGYCPLLLSNAPVRYTGMFLPVSSILKLRWSFATNCLHIASVICVSFLDILQLVIEVKCKTGFLPLFLSFLSFYSCEICCVRPCFLQINSLTVVNRSLFICLLSGRRLRCVLKQKLTRYGSLLICVDEKWLEAFFSKISTHKLLLRILK